MFAFQFAPPQSASLSKGGLRAPDAYGTITCYYTFYYHIIAIVFVIIIVVVVVIDIIIINIIIIIIISSSSYRVNFVEAQDNDSK